jgi:hypothetical protein
MFWGFVDRKPVGERIQEHVDNSAAYSMLMKEAEKDKSKSVSVTFSLRKIRCVLILLFATLYVLTSAMATSFAKREIEKRYEGNLDYLMMYLGTTMNDENRSLNSIYTLETIEEEYQLFSVAFFTEDGKLKEKTEDCVYFTIEGKTYYFPLTDYFNEEEQTYLREVGTTYIPIKHIIKAEIDVDNEILQSMEVTNTSQDANPGESVWKWNNPNTPQGKVEKTSFRGKVAQCVSIPYFDDEILNARWRTDEYLQGFEEQINLSEVEDTDSQKVISVLGIGKKQGTLIIRSSSAPWKAAMSRMEGIYYMGFALTAVAIYLTIFMTKRIKEAHQD